MKRKTATFSMFLAEETKTQAQALADREDVSLAHIVRRALRAWLGQMVIVRHNDDEDKITIYLGQEAIDDDTS